MYEIPQPFLLTCLTFVYVSYSFNMKLSDMVPLEEGVFQLEQGHGQWNSEECESAIIASAGCETDLITKEFREDEDVL